MSLDTRSQQQSHTHLARRTAEALPHNARSTKASACGKAILVGEHAVVYGARAVALPLPALKTSIHWQPNRQLQSDGRPIYRIMLGSKRASDHLSAVVEDAFNLLDIEPFSVDIEGHSSVLMGAGLGSSAALCVVVLRALAKSVGLHLTSGELAQLGNRLEARFHGTPSGLDAAVVAHEQLIAFRKGSLPEAFAAEPSVSEGVRRPWRFALIDSTLRAPTMAMIKVAAPFFQSQRQSQLIAWFDTLADQTVAGLLAGDPLQVAAAMREANGLLTEAGLVTSRLEEMITASETLGVLAAKVTGAGGGGCILALLKPTAADQQVQALRGLFGITAVTEVTL